MPTRIVFASGAQLEVDSPILDLVALLETYGPAGRPLVSAVDSSRQLFVNLEHIEYLEAVAEAAEDRRQGPAAVRGEAEAASAQPVASAPVEKPFWARKGSARRSLDLGRFSALPTARLPRADGRAPGDSSGPAAASATPVLASHDGPDS